MLDNKRIIIGFLMAIAFVIIALINDFWLNFVLFGALLYFAIKEGEKLFQNPNINTRLLALAAFVIGSFTGQVFFVGVLILLLAMGVLAYQKAKNLRSLYAFFYPTLPLLAMWQLYLDKGMFALFWLVFIVAFCDSGAYFVGKFIGRTPFSKSSPSKTLEGVIGGVVIASFFGTLFGLFMYNFWLSLLASVLVSIFAVFGDLFESYLKRRANVKDSANLIPGHGGILDRIDAVIFASFVLVALL